MRIDYGTSQVNEKKKALMEAKRLVLVLDLDNTLLHSSEFRMKSEMARRPEYKKRENFAVYDAEKSKYHIWWPYQFSYIVKLRPFCAEFLMQAMHNYEIHFNTAATRSYGEMILRVIKYEITKAKIILEKKA